MLKNFSKGIHFEKKISIEFHQEGIPLLVSPKLLRERNLGQIDLARFTRGFKEIELLEVKSSEQGEEAMRIQRRRLRDSSNFLSALFGRAVKCITKVG